MSAIQDALDWLLDDAAADLAAAGIPEPERVYVSHNTPAVDFGACSQLTVHLVSASPKPLANTPPERCVMVLWGRVAFQVWRCTTGTTTPSPEQLGATSSTALADANAILRGIMARRRDGTLLPPGPPYQSVIGAMTPLGPSGASAGW